MQCVDFHEGNVNAVNNLKVDNNKSSMIDNNLNVGSKESATDANTVKDSSSPRSILITSPRATPPLPSSKARQNKKVSIETLKLDNLSNNENLHQRTDSITENNENKDKDANTAKTSRSSASGNSSASNTSRQSFEIHDFSYPLLSARSRLFLESSKDESSKLKKSVDHRKSIGTPLVTPRSTNERKSFSMKELKLSDCELIKVLGIGGFGKVRLARVKQTGKLIALKTQSKKAILSANMETAIINEIQLMREMNHPFIAKVYCAFQDKIYIHIALELLLCGDFFSLLKREVKFTEEKAIFYSSIVVLALEALHSVKIAYRDLKPENLVLNQKGYVKLVDFGLAKRVKNGKCWTLCGTADYMAPEIVDGRGHGCPVDWWALGAIIYEMIDGFPPFYNENQMKVYRSIQRAEVKFKPTFSLNLQDFLKKLFIKNPNDRLGYGATDGIAKIQKHPWFEKMNWKNLLKENLPPPYVPTLTSAIDTSYFDNISDIPSDKDQEVEWEANLELTLMERRQAELGQLSKIWSTIVEKSNNEESRLGKGFYNNWTLESNFKNLTVDDSVIITNSSGRPSLAKSENNNSIRFSLSPPKLLERRETFSSSKKSSLNSPFFDDDDEDSENEDDNDNYNNNYENNGLNENFDKRSEYDKKSEYEFCCDNKATEYEEEDNSFDLIKSSSRALFPEANENSTINNSTGSEKQKLIKRRQRRWSTSMETPRIINLMADSSPKYS